MDKKAKGELKGIRQRLDSVRVDLSDLASELRAEWDEREENWQRGTAGEAANDQIDELENTAAALETIVETLETLHGK